MHIPDTRLNRALMETLIAEAERTAERDWSKSNHPNVWNRIADAWHAARDNVTSRPTKGPVVRGWYHRHLHH
jgi:hypothetical protein